MFAPRCTFRQYLKYTWLVWLPFIWSVPLKFLVLLFKFQFRSKLSDSEKRQRLAKMVLETSLVLGFRMKEEGERYLFTYERFRMPTKECNKKAFEYFQVRWEIFRSGA